MAEQQVAVAAAPQPVHQPPVLEGGHTQQAAIGQSEEAQPGFVPPPPPPPGDLSPEARAAQIVPGIGITVGELRVIDGLVENIECFIAPWEKARVSDLRFNPAALSVAITSFQRNFITAQPDHRPIGQSPKALEELKRRLQRGHIPGFIEEIRATQNAGAAPALAPLAEWLGLKGVVKHRYTLTPKGGGQVSRGVAEASGQTYELRYSGDLLPSWSATLTCAALGVGPSVAFLDGGLKTKPQRIAASDGITIDSFNFIHPDDVPSAWLDFAKAGAGAAEEAWGVSELRLHVADKVLTFRSAGRSKEEDGLGVRAGANLGLGYCVGPELADVETPRALEPVAPGQRSAGVAPLRLCLYFDVGSPELRPANQRALEELVGQVADTVRSLHEAEPMIHLCGRASAEWKAARDSVTAYDHNESLAVDRTLAVQAAMETRFDNAGLAARFARSITTEAAVGATEGEVLDREVTIEVAFELRAPEARCG